MGNDGADGLAVAGCGHAEVPERDWVGLKNTYSHNAEQDPMTDLVDFDPDVSSVVESSSGFLTSYLQLFFLSDDDLMKELEEDG